MLMNRLFSSIAKNQKRLAGLSLALAMAVGVVGPASASAAEASAKVAIGSAGAEVSAAADPIITCGPSPADKDSSAWGKYFKVNGVNIRKSPSTSSAICGQGQKSHTVDYHCWKVGSDGRTWTYLRDATTRRAGWVRDDLLKGNGSLVHC
jgi:hypothetical protein